jgi:phosphoglycerate dehydrogenase-like enzyme
MQTLRISAATRPDVVAGRVSEHGLAKADNLKWIHTWSAGPDAQLFPAFLQHPAVLTCSRGSGAIPLAERVMLQILTLTHDLRRSLAAQAEKRWEPFFHAELTGMTIGIIGTGNSGLDLAQKAKAFHMRVLGIRRRDDVPPHFDRMYKREELHAFLAESDFVVVTAPRTPETTGMLGAQEFAVMKPTAYYFCISRGGIADDEALLDALTRGTIAGAGLDAHGVEPLPPESPFWNLPNVIISAHNGATTNQNRERRFGYFVENLKNYLAGKPFFNVVDKEAGY